MRAITIHRIRRETGFTLVELLVSMVIIILMLGVLMAMTDSTRKTWSYTTSKVEQFREAREGFEAITRRLSQAVLNTYWDYQYSTGTPPVPTGYGRQSELRFVSGDTATLGISTNRPTHAVFFQAPLGFVNNNAPYLELGNLLNTVGYCIEFGDDSNLRPPFLSSMAHAPALRNRFRLIEMLQASQDFTLYKEEAAATPNGNASYNAQTWFTAPLGTAGATGRPVRVLAENIIALVIIPKLSPQDENALQPPPTSPGTALSPTYNFDSTLTYNGSSPPSTANAAALDPKNQLPPLVQVTMVAVDEATYARFQGTATTIPAALGLGSLFTPAVGVNNLTDATQPGYAQDLKTLRSTLQANRLNYRVFTSEVSLKGAKWSRDQTN